MLPLKFTLIKSEFVTICSVDVCIALTIKIIVTQSHKDAIALWVKKKMGESTRCGSEAPGLASGKLYRCLTKASMSKGVNVPQHFN